MAESRTLTDPFIRNHSTPDSIIEIPDEHTTGLAVRITTTGYKSFVFRYRFGDKVRRFTIGAFPKVGLKKARERAGELHDKVKRGIDPMEEKKKKINAPKPKTISDLADAYKRRHFPTLKESTRSTYRSRIDSEILPAFSEVPIKELNRGDIITFLEEIVYEEDKHVHANRVRNVLSSMYSFAVQKGIAEFNPVKTVKPVGQETSRRRVYDDEEIKALWGAFEKQEYLIEGILKLLLVLGQRKGETLQMKWSDIKNEVWAIPKEATKNGRMHYVPLSDMALQILNNLKGITGDSEYVFNSNRRKGPIRWLGNVPERIRDLSNVDDFRMHDLRRTCASNMTKLGIDRTVLGKVLNHKGLAGDNQVTAIYDRYDYMDEKKEALNRWSKHLDLIIKGNSEARVYKIS